MGISRVRAFAESLERRLFLSAGAVASFFVDGTHGSDPGNDANAGLGMSPANAFKTIQEAANQAATIDATATANNAAAPPIVVYIEQGTYREMVSVTGCANVTFLPYENEAVTVSGLDLVQFNAGADAGTAQVWTSQPLYPTDYSATTDQLVLGPSATTATDQVFQNGQMVPESRYPENPLPNRNDTSTQSYARQRKRVTILQTPREPAAPSTFAQTGTSDAAYFAASFDDPNLLNFAGSAKQRKGLSSAQLLGALQSFLDGATIHIRADQWGWETGTISDVELDGTTRSPAPRITYTLASSTSLTNAPPPGCFYYLSNFADSNPQAMTVAQALAFGNAPSKVMNAAGIRIATAAASGYVIDNNPASTTYLPASAQGPLYLHMLARQQPAGVEIKTRDVAFDLSHSQNITIRGITLMAATIATDSASSDDIIANVTAAYLSSYDRTNINASTRRTAALPNYEQIRNANIAGGMPLGAATAAASATAATMAAALQAGETSAVDIWVQFVSGIELMGPGDKLIDSTVEYCAGNGVTIAATGAAVSGCTIHDVDTMGTDNAGVITLPPGYSIKSAAISQGTTPAYTTLPGNYTTALVTITPQNPNTDFAVNDWVYVEGLSYDSPQIHLGDNFAGNGTYQITSVNPDHSFTYQYPLPTNNLIEILNGQPSRISTGIADGYAGHVIGKYPGSISADPMQILGNTIFNAGRSDIVYRGAVNLSIERNNLSFGGLVTIDCGGTYSWGEDASQNIDGVDAGGNPVNASANSDIAIEYNTIHDMNCIYGTGIYLDTNNSGVTVEHNIIYNVQFGMTFSPPSIDPVVKYNTFSPNIRAGAAPLSLESQNVEEAAAGFNVGQGNHVGAAVQFNLFGAANAPDGTYYQANVFSDVPDLTNDTTNYIPKNFNLGRVTSGASHQNFNLKSKIKLTQEDLRLTQAPSLYMPYYPGSNLAGPGAIPYGTPWMSSGVNLTATAGAGGTVTLNWTTPLPSATSKVDPFVFRIYRYALGPSSIDYDQSNLVATVGRGTTWTDTLPAFDPLVPPPTYVYFVRALNESASTVDPLNSTDAMLYASLSNEAAVAINH